MKTVAWILFIAAIVGMVTWFRSWRRREEERQRASEQRLAALMSAHLKPPAATKDRLLLDAAAKAAEAGEPALSIQLYARLIARFPDSVLAAQARLAVEEQKRLLAKA